MCNNCYRYFLRHGVQRPRRDSSHSHAIICTNCGGEIVKGRKRHGLCNNCASFLRKNGRMRTKEDIKCKPGGICKNCRAGIALTKGLCKTCYNYKNHTGLPRPRRCYSRPEQCKNCGYPLVPGQRGGIGRPSKGLCRRCYEYQLRFKVSRPEYLWDKGANGWCDCGKPATQEIAVRIHNHTDRIPVCDECYAEEMRQITVYGENHDRKGTGRDSAVQS